MRRRLLIAAIVLVVLAPFVFVGIVLYTPAGLSLVAGQLWRLERLGVHITGVSGTLSGPLRIELFELDHPRVHVVVHDIVIHTELRGLLLQTLQASSVTAHDAVVVLHDAEMPPSTRPPRFLPQFLRVDARKVEITRVRYEHTNGTVVDAKRAAAGRVTITARTLQVRDGHADGQFGDEQFDAAGGLTLRAGKPFGMSANARGHLQMSNGVTLALGGKADGNFDRLEIAAQLLQPQQASARALLTRPDERWNIAGHVDAPAFALDPFLQKPPFSLRNVALDVQANPDRISVAGNVGIPELDSKDLTVEASGNFAKRVLTLASSDIALNDSAARVHAKGTVTFDGDAPTLDVAATWENLQWPLHGNAVVTSATGEGTLRGPLPYDFTTTAQVDGPNLPPAQGSARGVLSKEELTVAQYDIKAFDGTATGSAQLQFAKPRAWKVAVSAADINPVELHEEFPGRIDVRAQAEGKGFDKQASFRLALTNLRGTLRNEPVRARGTVQRDGKTWQVSDARLAFGGARATLDGKLLRDTIDARWSVRAPALDRLLPDAGGSIESTGSASGALKSPHVVAQVHGENLRYAGWLAQQLELDADVDAAGNNPSRLTVQARQLGRGSPLIDRLQVTGTGVATDHRIALDVTGFPPQPKQAAPHAVMDVAGRYDKEVWTATVTTTELSTGAPNQQLKAPQPATVLASRDRAQLDNFCLVIGAGRMCAEGNWQRGGAWQATVSGYEIPLASVLPPSGAEAEIAGRIEGRVHAFGAAGQPWQGEAGARIIDAAIIYRPAGAAPETLNLGTGGLAATAKPERIELSFGIQAFTDTFLFANARLQRDGRNDILHLPLTGDMRARAADANILPLLFPEIDHAAGLLTANATVGGTLALPEFNGRIELARGEFDSYRVNLAMRELGVVADLENTGLRFRGQGRAGDGQLQADGHLTWRGGESQGELRVRGQNLLVADLPEYRVVASPDLRFQVDGKRMDVAGDVKIPSARVQPAQLTGAVKASDDARYVGEHPAERAGLFVVHSEVRIDMGDDVRVDAFGLQGRIVGGVGTTVQTGETPIGRGELSVSDGRYEAYGQKLEINRGRLLFDASPLDDPGLDIEARRRIETTEVGLNVRGTLQEPRLTFFSDPSMTQSQIMSYLLTGKSVDSITGAETKSISAASDSLAMQGGGFLASQLGRRIGIEEVGVESTVNSAGEANTALVLGKFLSPRLFVSYGISLTESINTLKLRYTISDKWVLKTEAGENQSADLEYATER
ncbi:MAG TPA: translocation/assembly module TamB domain-containing protein [Steroidobacteraceae bacterium]|nr:translocation/assembly module TamB domain-containing protein [Steroidobacteraceae bacterium]